MGGGGLNENYLLHRELALPLIPSPKKAKDASRLAVNTFNIVLKCKSDSNHDVKKKAAEYQHRHNLWTSKSCMIDIFLYYIDTISPFLWSMIQLLSKISLFLKII